MAKYVYIVAFGLFWVLWFSQFQGSGDVPWWDRVPWWQWTLAGLCVACAFWDLVDAYLEKRTKR